MKTWAATLVLMISLLNVVGLGSKSKVFAESLVGISFSESSPLAQGASSNEDCHVPCPSVHVCHLGHCDFVVGVLSGLDPPENGFTTHRLLVTSFSSVDLPATKKPPKA